MGNNPLTIDVDMLISSTMVDGTMSSIDICSSPGHGEWTGEINSLVDVNISTNNL